MNLNDRTVLRAPQIETLELDGTRVLIAPDRPAWLATDGAGESILRRFDGTRTLARIAADHAAEAGLAPVKAWHHVDTIARDAVRAGLLAEPNGTPVPYAGREEHVRDLPLDELWLHVNDACNLRCTHCLVSSGPDGDRGPPTAFVLDAISQARELGAKRFHITGGEPLLRRDLQEILAAILEDPEAEVSVLTNGIFVSEKRVATLRELDVARLRLQVSLDGATPETNDAIRGRGSLAAACSGIRNAAAGGLDVTVSTVITSANADEVAAVTVLAAELGARRHHLLWLHRRGRAEGSGPDHAPPVERVIEVVREARGAATEHGILLDNHEALITRLRAPAGVRRDLSSACVTSVCVGPDGYVYPSAATSRVPELRLGSLRERPLAELLRESGVARRFRAASVVRKPLCPTCPLQFLCGGGDLEHAWFWGGSLDAQDPWCELHKAMFRDAFQAIAEERRGVHTGRRSGFDAPVAFASSGDDGTDCASRREPRAVEVTGSECVRSFEADARIVVREFYGDAAESPQPELCCPVRPDPEELAHVPSEVVERFYGCGSPIARADLRPGETTLDLGCGAGIDVFLAAKRVGSTGRAIGVDMTGRMLAVARGAQPEVARRLGFDVVDFREGFLERVPADDGSVDLVTSNCVVNLSPDKKKVFAEVWRVLRDHGRLVLSDIVSDGEVPPHLRRNPRLWGECISGALTEEELLAWLERAGFHGLRVLSRTFWKEVEGRRFLSVTVRGEKFAKRAGCVFAGHAATYLGPYKGVADEEGHWFPRNVSVEVCTDTVAKLLKPPYAGAFRIEGPDGALDGAAGAACSADGSCC